MVCTLFTTILTPQLVLACLVAEVSNSYDDGTCELYGMNDGSAKGNKVASVKQGIRAILSHVRLTWTPPGSGPLSIALQAFAGRLQILDPLSQDLGWCS